MVRQDGAGDSLDSVIWASQMNLMHEDGGLGVRGVFGGDLLQEGSVAQNGNNVMLVSDSF